MTGLVHGRWIPRWIRLVFDRSEEIYIVNADGSGFSLAIVDESCPHWSPDPRSADVIHRGFQRFSSHIRQPRTGFV